MHYEPQYLWQEETFERKWCVACTTCPYLNFDVSNTECYNNALVSDVADVSQCRINDQIWIVNCDRGYGQYFTIRPLLLPTIPLARRSRVVKTTLSNVDPQDDIANYYYHQIQIVSSNVTTNNDTTTTTAAAAAPTPALCLHRTETRFVVVQTCHTYDPLRAFEDYTASHLAQLWDPVVPYHWNNNNDSAILSSTNRSSSSINATTTTTTTMAHPNIANDGIKINDTSYITFTLTPAILLPNIDEVKPLLPSSSSSSSTNSTNNSSITTNTNATTMSNTTTYMTWCLTNQHHPKSEEIVALKPCSISDKWNTGYWDLYPTQHSGVKPLPWNNCTGYGANGCY
jgi:hypothetical protein